jgi:hypothetical protein
LEYIVWGASIPTSSILESLLHQPNQKFDLPIFNSFKTEDGWYTGREGFGDYTRQQFTNRLASSINDEFDYCGLPEDDNSLCFVSKITQPRP